MLHPFHPHPGRGSSEGSAQSPSPPSSSFGVPLLPPCLSPVGRNDGPAGTASSVFVQWRNGNFHPTSRPTHHPPHGHACDSRGSSSSWEARAPQTPPHPVPPTRRRSHKLEAPLGSPPKVARAGTPTGLTRACHPSFPASLPTSKRLPVSPSLSGAL